MKKLIIGLLLCLPLLSQGMEQNKVDVPKTPSPKKSATSPFGTPEKVKQAKLAVANSLLEAINGYPNEQDLQEDDLGGAEVLALSPKKFVDHLRAMFLQAPLFEEKGVTPQMIEDRLQTAQEALEARSFEADYYEQLSSPLRKEAQAALKSIEVDAALVEADHIDDHAYATARTVVVNPDRLQKLASTPRRRNVLFKHEGAHIKHRDVARKNALLDALQDQKIAAAVAAQSSVQQLVANPSKFSPETKEKVQQYIRIGEAFADSHACSSPSSSLAAVRLWQEIVKSEGQGTPEDHPSNEARLKLAHVHAHMHAAQARLLERKRRAAQSENIQRVMPGKRKLKYGSDDESDSSHDQDLTDSKMKSDSAKPVKSERRES